MTQAADEIVVARVTGVSGTGLDSTSYQTVPYTNFQVGVTQWLKGSGASSIVVKQTGGPDASGAVWTVDDDPLLQIGDEDILFLHEFAAGEYLIVGGPTGRFPVRSGVVYAMPTGIATDGLPESISAFAQRVGNTSS